MKCINIMWVLWIMFTSSKQFIAHYCTDVVEIQKQSNNELSRNMKKFIYCKY